MGAQAAILPTGSPEPRRGGRRATNLRSIARPITALVLLLSYAHAPALSQDRAASCRAFVAAFYRWYTRSAEHGGFEAAVRRRRGSFSSELVRRLNEDTAAQARTSGEITGLDFDPFLNAQDVAQRYTVGRVTHRGSRYFAQVSAIWNGKKESKPAVTPELIFTGGRWVFLNFHY